MTPAPDSTARPAPRTVAVVGAGTMGRQIAAMAAAHGQTVTLYDVVPGAIENAMARLREELPPVFASGFWPGDLESTLANLRPETDLAAAVVGADLVIEAVKEDLAVKRVVFAELAALAPGAILATNSSSLPSARIADAIPDPERLLNLHFFAPIWDRAMLEVMSSGATDPAIIDACAAWGRGCGLAVAVVQGQSMGFIINRVWRAIKRESLRVVDEGHADPEDVDRLFMGFFGSSFGPFGMMDTVGLDTVADIERSYVAVAADPTDRVSPHLLEMVAAGTLGEKTGQGFYRYPDPAYRQPGFKTGAPAGDAEDDAEGDGATP